jgi:hypothetical protein
MAEQVQRQLFLDISLCDGSQKAMRNLARGFEAATYFKLKLGPFLTALARRNIPAGKSGRRKAA